MTYVLGAKSNAALVGVAPHLADVVRTAIHATDQDFSVHEGLRTIETQRQYVARGVSQTMNSMHLKQPDGFGHAVDLVPWVAGVLRWEWPPIYVIAEAMRVAALGVGVSIRWGGVWDRRLEDLKPGAAGMEAEVAAYVARRKKAGVKRVFIDGPHFELSK